jgi:pantoate--beta-alanine ligase
LNFPIEIVTAPLVRDTDGVALSSRNKYLSAADRERARVLSRSLFAAQRGELDAEGVRNAIAAAADKVDYVVWLDADTLEEPTANTREILVAVAAYFGTTRLIDNMLIQEKK